jgi:signal peptidase I
MSSMDILRQLQVRTIKSLMLLIVLGLVSMATISTYWYAHGGRIKTVESGSMAPVMSVGDAVVLMPAKPASLSVGDIINYSSPHNAQVTVTHRIVNIDNRAERLTTKGDALNQNDPAIPFEAVVGRAVAVAPNLGKLLDMLHRPLLMAIIVYIPALAVVFFEMRRLAAINSSGYRYPSYR